MIRKVEKAMEKLKEAFLIEVKKLQDRHELASKIAPDYYEPGMMEYLEQSYGIYNEETKEIILRFEVKGTRYEGRTELIETVNVGDTVLIQRDEENEYNANNFVCLTLEGKTLGFMPAELCNALATLYDSRVVTFHNSFVSFVEPVSKRSRHAKQAILFVELLGIMN